MFLDLKDSTPIAETLGHEKYFSFIKDFIYYVSSAVLLVNFAPQPGAIAAHDSGGERHVRTGVKSAGDNP